MTILIGKKKYAFNGNYTPTTPKSDHIVIN